MPLPKIATPTYELVLPSSGETVKYRPFLVKEEKLLLVALQSQNQKQITTAVKNVIKECVMTRGVKVDTLPTFDIEYLFLNIRGKSVGEELEVNLVCPDDGATEVKKKIGLHEILVLIDDENNDTIDIDGDLKLKLKFPSLDEFIKSNFETGDDDTIEASFDLIASCIDKIYNDEEIWEGKDSSKKELREFIDQLSSKQFKEIEKFFETMPKLSYTTKIINPKTKVESEVTLEGLASFFA
jgi:hypothetical protein|tara:strand:+ start:4561 stop:5280 length:720 start_codon:yes stop_codon:yes gene_type:complete